jgi:hypothetical protein
MIGELQAVNLPLDCGVRCLCEPAESHALRHLHTARKVFGIEIFVGDSGREIKAFADDDRL